MSVRDRRVQYETAGLDRSDLDSDPIVQWHAWYEQAASAGVAEPNAMTVATVDQHSAPDSRVVLARAVDARGFVFYTNYLSKKGNAIAENPKVSLHFFWPNLERQVIISGIASKVVPDVSDAYFASRPTGSQLGAHVSPQSDIIASREVLEARQAALEEQFAGKDIPRPSHWGGIVVAPFEMEFWQGRPNRLHDRIVYLKQDDSWSKQRKAP